jgi:hypothetical protein
MSARRFVVDGDPRAREWLGQHRAGRPRVIAYEVHRCCGGGKIGQVRVREQSGKDDPGELDTGALDDSTVFLIDRRAAARLPLRFIWGRLLYD